MMRAGSMTAAGVRARAAVEKNRLPEHVIAGRMPQAVADSTAACLDENAAFFLLWAAAEGDA